MGSRHVQDENFSRLAIALGPNHRLFEKSNTRMIKTQHWRDSDSPCPRTSAFRQTLDLPQHPGPWLSSLPKPASAVAEKCSCGQCTYIWILHTTTCLSSSKLHTFSRRTDTKEVTLGKPLLHSTDNITLQVSWTSREPQSQESKTQC